MDKTESTKGTQSTLKKSSDALYSLPPEILLEIINNLDVKDIISLGSTNKHFKSLILDDPNRIWRLVCKRDLFLDPSNSLGSYDSYLDLLKNGIGPFHWLKTDLWINDITPFGDLYMTKYDEKQGCLGLYKVLYKDTNEPNNPPQRNVRVIHIHNNNIITTQVTHTDNNTVRTNITVNSNGRAANQNRTAQTTGSPLASDPDIKVYSKNGTPYLFGPILHFNKFQSREEKQGMWIYSTTDGSYIGIFRACAIRQNRLNQSMSLWPPFTIPARDRTRNISINNFMGHYEPPFLGIGSSSSDMARAHAEHINNAHGNIPQNFFHETSQHHIPVAHPGVHPMPGPHQRQQYHPPHPTGVSIQPGAVPNLNHNAIRISHRISNQINIPRNNSNSTGVSLNINNVSRATANSNGNVNHVFTNTRQSPITHNITTTISSNGQTTTRTTVTSSSNQAQTSSSVTDNGEDTSSPSDSSESSSNDNSSIDSPHVVPTATIPSPDLFRFQRFQNLTRVYGKVQTMARLNRDLYSSTEQFPYRGIWVSSMHSQIHLFHQPQDNPNRLEAVKITGDPHVGRGKHNFIVPDLTDIAQKTNGRGEAVGPVKYPEWRDANVVNGQGQVSEFDFRNRKFFSLFLIFRSNF